MKSFQVEIWFGSQRTNLVLQAHNSAQAISIAKKVYPSGRVIKAVEIK